MNTKEIIALSDADLKEKLGEERAIFQKLKFNHAVSPIENPNKIKLSRRLIAQYLTEQNRRKNEMANTNA